MVSGLALWQGVEGLLVEDVFKLTDPIQKVCAGECGVFDERLRQSLGDSTGGADVCQRSEPGVEDVVAIIEQILVLILVLVFVWVWCELWKLQIAVVPLWVSRVDGADRWEGSSAEVADNVADEAGLMPFLPELITAHRAAGGQHVIWTALLAQSTSRLCLQSHGRPRRSFSLPSWVTASWTRSEWLL